MASSDVKKSYFNSNLFHIDGVPMRFFLEGYDDCQFHNISRIVEAYGGKLTPDTGTIVFSEPGRYSHTDRRRFHIRCIRDSIVHNKLQDINKYALPWKIIQAQEDNSPKMITSENVKKPLKETIILPASNKKLESSSLSQPYVLIQDCFTTHPAILKQQKLNNSRVTESHSRNVIEREQSSVVSSSRGNVTPPFIQLKIADKASPIAAEAVSSSVPAASSSLDVSLAQSSPPINPSIIPNNGNVIRENPRSGSAKKSQSIEFIQEIRTKPPVVHEIIELSDSEDPTSYNGLKKGPETSEKSLKSDESTVDWKSVTNFDVPNSYAVWSSAGPPGPPNLSDSDDERQRNDPTTLGVIKIKEEKDSEVTPRPRKEKKRIRYYDWDTDSDGAVSSKSKGGKRKRKKRSSHEYDQNYSGSRGRTRGAYTEEENRQMIQYLIDNGLISKSTQLHVWMKFSIKKILANPVRKPESLKRYFEDQLIFNFEKYTDDPVAVEAFSKIRNELI